MVCIARVSLRQIAVSLRLAVHNIAQYAFQLYRRCEKVRISLHAQHEFVCRFASHEIQMHTKVEKRCAYPFYNASNQPSELLVSDTQSCVRACVYHFIQVQACNADNMCILCVQRVHFVCMKTEFCCRRMCMQGQLSNEGKFAIFQHMRQFIFSLHKHFNDDHRVFWIVVLWHGEISEYSRLYE